MFSQHFWYMGIVTLFVIALEVFAAMYAANHRRLARAILWCVATFVLVYEIQYFARTREMPIAFSTFTYFLFGIAAFVPLRPLKSAAAFCSFLAGAVYLSAFVFYPDLIYVRQPTESERMIGFLLHNLMLFGSLLLYSQCRAKSFDIVYVAGFTAFSALYTEIAVHVFATNAANTLFVGIIEATLIQQVLPQFEVRWWWYVLWYPLAAVALWGMWELASFVNRRLVRQ